MFLNLLFILLFSFDLINYAIWTDISDRLLVRISIVGLVLNLV